VRRWQKPVSGAFRYYRKIKLTEQSSKKFKQAKTLRCYPFIKKGNIMATRGSKVERHSVSEQSHELKYEAKKTGTSKEKVEAAKKSAGSNQRSAVEKKLNKNS